MLEVPEAVNRFGHELYDRRSDIERDFSQLTCFGAVPFATGCQPDAPNLSQTLGCGTSAWKGLNEPGI